MLKSLKSSGKSLLYRQKKGWTSVSKKKKKKKNIKKKKYSESMSRDFQFHRFSKFQSLLLIGKPWVFRFLKKMLVLTF